MDAKMHRKTSELVINALYLEPDIPFTARLTSGLQEAITAFGEWQGAQRIRIASQPQSLQAVWGTGWEIRRP